MLGTAGLENMFNVAAESKDTGVPADTRGVPHVATRRLAGAAPSVVDAGRLRGTSAHAEACSRGGAPSEASHGNVAPALRDPLGGIAAVQPTTDEMARNG